MRSAPPAQAARRSKPQRPPGNNSSSVVILAHVAFIVEGIVHDEHVGHLHEPRHVPLAVVVPALRGAAGAWGRGPGGWGETREWQGRRAVGWRAFRATIVPVSA